MNANTPDASDATPASDIDDCWNRIGVRGDASCPQLERHVHCRNCPVHEAAAARVLDRVEARTSLDQTGSAAADARRSDLEADTLSCLVFRIGAEWLALPTTICAQVAQLRPVHSLPHRRHRAVVGVVNVRGRLIACVSLGRLFDIEASPGVTQPAAGHQTVDARELGRLLVIQRVQGRDHHVSGDAGGPLAFPVDAVDGVHRFARAQLQPVPATLAQRLASHAHAVGEFRGATVGLLDAERLFDSLSRSLA
jgi:chemotaxis-related protein WspD